MDAILRSVDVCWPPSRRLKESEGVDGDSAGAVASKSGVNFCHHAPSNPNRERDLEEFLMEPVADYSSSEDEDGQDELSADDLEYQAHDADTTDMASASQPFDV